MCIFSSLILSRCSGQNSESVLSESELVKNQLNSVGLSLPPLILISEHCGARHIPAQFFPKPHERSFFNQIPP